MIEELSETQDVLRLVLSSKLEHLESVVERTEAFISSRISDDELCYRVVLLVSEAVTNAIEHGNEHDAQKKVRVEIGVFSDCIEVSVEDEGQGFDPDAIEDPLEEDNVMSDRGRGLYFIDTMADEVYYEREGSKVQMLFYRNGE